MEHLKVYTTHYTLYITHYKLLAAYYRLHNKHYIILNNGILCGSTNTVVIDLLTDLVKFPPLSLWRRHAKTVKDGASSHKID